MKFIDRTNDRALAPDYAGDVLVWDIDKTYLDTRFSSVRGLLGIPFDMAVDKRAVPGAVALLRGLRHGPHQDSLLVPLHFISGSPRQLRAVVQKKMTLDGVQYDGVAFKDQLGYLRALRPRAIKEQVGYKLTCLLMLYAEGPASARFWLFGDDVEQDVVAFLLFGRVVAGLRGTPLRKELERLKVARAEQDDVIGVCASLPIASDPVQRVLLHEVRGGPLAATDARVTRSSSFLSHAAVLFACDKVTLTCVARVQADVVAHGMTRQDALTLVADTIERQGIDADHAALLRTL